ncbi:hypothetical protein [Marinitenerispora sediminis]|uniref:Uncharacterized protein n=1 Tax=Marinitenerispora sediminis TaxID=1931232 RepID=A0A368TA55_9ACTN|nr:hypothetical protein [Marinitenerispora sediminis]RCV51637.1 hypothetical protein DEF23_20050 [Marinitenerispora sediminis]RCV52969.1 hypothetical protein DEF28_11575 [Marinitenerispora sediminis]RCV61772.1 hypothetical protein DEF24_03315 [Marinitenerispora sediminis]
MEEALEDPGPWPGFCAVVEKVCAMQATDRGFPAAFPAQFPDNTDYARERARAEWRLAELGRRAEDAGKLRADFEVSDMPLLLPANSGVVQESPQASLAASHRLVGYLRQSFRADRTGPPGRGWTRCTGRAEQRSRRGWSGRRRRGATAVVALLSCRPLSASAPTAAADRTRCRGDGSRKQILWNSARSGVENTAPAPSQG